MTMTQTTLIYKHCRAGTSLCIYNNTDVYIVVLVILHNHMVSLVHTIRYIFINKIYHIYYIFFFYTGLRDSMKNENKIAKILTCRYRFTLLYMEETTKRETNRWNILILLCTPIEMNSTRIRFRISNACHFFDECNVYIVRNALTTYHNNNTYNVHEYK